MGVVEKVVKDGKTGFGVNNMPAWLHWELNAMAKANYGDQRWVMLLDLHRKAQAYDMLCAGITVAEKEDVSEAKEKASEEQVVKTFGGNRK